jgi:hypothetical protein
MSKTLVIDNSVIAIMLSKPALVKVVACLQNPPRLGGCRSCGETMAYDYDKLRSCLAYIGAAETRAIKDAFKVDVLEIHRPIMHQGRRAWALHRKS